MEEGEIDSETDQDPSVLEVPAINWARYVGVKSVQYVKMGHASRIAAEKNDWNLEQAVRETQKNFSTDLQPPVNSPNEEIQLDFIGPTTNNHRRFYILLSIDRYSK